LRLASSGAREAVLLSKLVDQALEEGLVTLLPIAQSRAIAGSRASLRPIRWRSNHPEIDGRARCVDPKDLHNDAVELGLRLEAPVEPFEGNAMGRGPLQ
jgi:hypothetical protein